MQFLPPESYGILVILVMPPVVYIYRRLGWASRPLHALEITGIVAILLVLLQAIVQWVYMVSIETRPLLHGLFMLPITAAAALWLSLTPGFLLDLHKSYWFPKKSRLYLVLAVSMPLIFLEISALSVLSTYSWAMTLVQTAVVSTAITLVVRSEWRGAAAKPAAESDGIIQPWAQGMRH